MKGKMDWANGDGKVCLRDQLPLNVSGSCHERFRNHIEYSVSSVIIIATVWM